MVPVTPIITRIAAQRYGASFPDAGGALGSEDNIRRILGAAGYTDIQVLYSALRIRAGLQGPLASHHAMTSTGTCLEIRHTAAVCIACSFDAYEELRQERCAIRRGYCNVTLVNPTIPRLLLYR